MINGRLQCEKEKMRMSYGVRKQQGRGDGIKLSTKEEHERMEVCQRRGRMTDKK